MIGSGKGLLDVYFGLLKVVNGCPQSAFSHITILSLSTVNRINRTKVFQLFANTFVYLKATLRLIYCLANCFA
jgi:hypothetical protein